MADVLEGYRKVHRLSPILRVWAFVLGLATLAAFNFTLPIYNWLREENVGLNQAAWVLGGFVLFLFVAFGLSQLWWARTGFIVGEEEVETRRGVLTNQVRSARYDRIQAVDVVEPFAPRLFGLAAVRIEVAGAASAGLDISYLPREEADEVRAQILRRIGQEGGATQLADSAPDEGDSLVPPIPISRSLVATTAQMSTLFTLAWSTVPLWTDLTAAAIVPVVIGFFPRIWGTIDSSWRFNSKKDGEVYHLNYGLANRRRQAVPRGRIHAVQLRQPMFWRFFGWWTVSVTVAGYGSERNKTTGTSKLLPVGTWEQAKRVVDAVGPLTAEELTDLEHATYRSPRRARWVSPIDWRRQTVTLRPDLDVVHLTVGRLGRWYQAVEIPHIQEISYLRTPTQRPLDLATVDLELVPGAFKMSCRDMDTGEALQLVDKLRARELPPLQADDMFVETSDAAREAELAPGLVDGD
ncbi:PH domain-containing protein [Corynebacterium sp. Marseille-P4321]|uniref:PH domain-containing protein n=1 Tax=Corynebacterium sp. Marseille-P4321 TaxID=2736603 RepID=UPI00158ABB45|nr:PH domain-containing protein [Corynebacterium sp. Marseille-P4321]